MKNVTKYALAVIATATSAMQVPSIQAAVTHFLGAHPGLASIVGGLAAVITLIHNPSKES